MKKIERNTNNDSSIRRYNYIPLIIIIIYLVLTYTIHLLKAESPSISGLLFISITDIAIVIGYLLPAQKRIHSGVNDWRFNRNIEKLIVICMIFTIINSLNNISSFYYGVENLFDFVTNPGKAYEYVKFLRNHPEYNLTGIRFGSTVGILLTLFSGTKYIYLLLSFLYWKQLKNKIKLFFFITTAVYVIQSLLLGAMITIAALFFSCMP
ncbi:MAG: hypothetical protein GX660_18795, partial [Clostridiaceae bacterium]|nr:hypothetical protein [Clostridiaceae bacterium]